MKRMVSCMGQEIRYEYQRKKVKNINIRVKPNGTIVVSAGYGVPAQEVDGIVRKRADWILRAQERVLRNTQQQASPPEYRDGEIFCLLGKECPLRVFQAERNSFLVTEDKIILNVRDIADDMLRQKSFERGYEDYISLVLNDAVNRMKPLFQEFAVPDARVRIRRMKTRWGSCVPAHASITMNAYLIHAPLSCIEYVAAHELAHFIVPNHSAGFYAVLQCVMPDFQERKALLNQQNIACSGL